MNLGGSEILVIIVIALIVLGPDKLPSALRMFGRVMGEVKKYQELAKQEIDRAMNEPIETSSVDMQPSPGEMSSLDESEDKKLLNDDDEELANSSCLVEPIIDEDE